MSSTSRVDEDPNTERSEPPESAMPHAEKAVQDSPDIVEGKPWQFWLVMFSLCLIAFVASVDGSIIAIALPRITSELKAGSSYVWIGNSFVLAQTVIQPPCAQLCNVFGRRMPMIISVTVFTIGSGIAGGASSTAMLIAGRTVQGLGSGGIMMLVELIVCDLVPLRERGKYISAILSTSAIGAVIGPVIGGALAQANWRWIFYLNIPIAGTVLVVMIFVLRLQYTKEPTWTRALARVDWIGNTLFVGSLCALLLGLIFGGTLFSWSTWHVILPIVLGAVGWACFHLFESSKLCKEPSVPPHLFKNRTSFAGFYLVFISSTLLQWVAFYWPIYFQGVQHASPLRAGINFIPFEAFLIPSATLAGGLMSKLGVYRPLHLAGFALSVIGPGLNTLLTASSGKAVWVIFQLIDAIGRGLLLPTILPAILASLSEADVAAATGMYSFLRSFGYIWGITIPSIIFNARFDHYSKRISDQTVRTGLSGGQAYQVAGSSYIRNLPAVVQREVTNVYAEALKGVWYGAVALGLTGYLAVFVEKHVTLRTELSTAYGLEERSSRADAEKDAAGVKNKGVSNVL